MVSISPLLHDQIVMQSAAMSLPFEQTLLALVKIGLAEQTRASEGTRNAV
jgi:hypothetical protein